MALEPPLRWGDEALMYPPSISRTLFGLQAVHLFLAHMYPSAFLHSAERTLNG